MKRKSVNLAGILALVVLMSVAFAGRLGAQASKKEAPPAAPVGTGPEIGEKIPSFAALDEDGKEQTFESLRGPKGLLLLIHRSADW